MLATNTTHNSITQAPTTNPTNSNAASPINNNPATGSANPANTNNNPTRSTPTSNSFMATVSKVRQSPCIAEISLNLDAGGQMCALIHPAENPNYAQGQRVHVYFKAFSVIIGLA